MSETTDYAKLDWRWQHHHERFHRFVTTMPRKLVCQECCGAGGEVEPVTDFGEGPFLMCGFCEGTGLVTPHIRGMWLRSKHS